MGLESAVVLQVFLTLVNTNLTLQLQTKQNGSNVNINNIIVFDCFSCKLLLYLVYSYFPNEKIPKIRNHKQKVMNKYIQTNLK